MANPAGKTVVLEAKSLLLWDVPHVYTWGRHAARRLCSWLCAVETIFLLLATLALLLTGCHVVFRDGQGHEVTGPDALEVERSHFEGFSNESGSSSPIVPNIVHFLRFDLKEMRFVDAVCILAVVKNHKPNQLFLHTNINNFTGKYWDYLLSIPEFYNIYKIKNIILPNTIFGQNFSDGWHKQHASDITRIRILMQYGGIFLDNDSYVIKNLNKYLNYEMVLGWDDNQFLGTQVLIAHPDARFLKLWLESYRDSYRRDLWYYNAGERPTQTVLFARPEMVHRVKLLLGVHSLVNQLYHMNWKEWRNYEAIHLLMNHRSYLDIHYKLYPEFNDTNIMNYEYTFGEMARKAYFNMF